MKIRDQYPRQFKLISIKEAIRSFYYINHKTRLIEIEPDFLYKIKVTECCKTGPIINENYCPKCGRKIIKT